jgi:hypothetical protein
VTLTLEAIAVHAMRRVNGSKELVTIGTADPASLTPRTQERFTDYVTRIGQLNEADGRARAAWWGDGGQPAELEQLADCPIGYFEQAAEAAMRRLFECTPGAASEGLALFVRARRDGEAPFVGCIKLRLADLHDVRYSGEVDPVKAVEDVDIEGILPKADQVLKAALIPNPSEQSDLRVMDDQLRDPASHWLEFLNANPRPTELAISRIATAALSAGLVAETTLDERGAAAIVADRLDAIVEDDESVDVRAFATRVAEQAEVEDKALWAAAVLEEPRVEGDHYELTPRAAKKLTSVYSLGYGIELRGPARTLDRRVEFVKGDGGWLLQLAVDGPVAPEYH